MVASMSIVSLVISILAVHAQFDKLPDGKIPPEILKCSESVGLQPKGKPMLTREPSSEEMCFFKCIMEEKGMLDADGNVKPETVDSSQLHIPQDKVDDVKQCLKNAGKVEKCEDIAKLVECMPQPA
uniref:Odorant-binding protein 3 n=1 Tax=Batocera horsfieldi TaxID=351105 RepID=U6BGA0_9CUCU|nr:odorant-binding protein 3 [Batocera horsfieldi]